MTKSNMAGDVSFFHCGAEDHLQYECPKFSTAERAELVKVNDERDEKNVVINYMRRWVLWLRD